MLPPDTNRGASFFRLSSVEAPGCRKQADKARSDLGDAAATRVNMYHSLNSLKADIWGII